jgi:hypothetical protein
MARAPSICFVAAALTQAHSRIATIELDADRDSNSIRRFWPIRTATKH